MAAAEQAEGGYRWRGSAGTQSPVSVLIALGFDAKRITWDALGSHMWRRILFGRRAILSLPSLNGFNGHHDVYWDGREIIDPTTQPNAYAPQALLSAKPLCAVVLDERLPHPRSQEP